MQRVKLGTSSLEISKLILGCMSFGDPHCGYHSWILNEQRSLPLIALAIESGINCFDTANMYSFGESERIVGRAVREFSSRSKVVICTKVFFSLDNEPGSGGLSRAQILKQADASLQRLGSDYIDLYQIHRWDDAVPIDETLEALHCLVKSGKVRYIGASSMFAWQLSKSLYSADLKGWSRFVSMQPHYNLLYREEEREMIPLCRDQQIGIIPWSPLARGRLTRGPTIPESDRYFSDDYGRILYQNSEAVDDVIVSRVREVSKQRGISQAQVALAWLVSKPYVCAPVIGVNEELHLKEAIGALAVTLDDAEIKYLEQAYQPHQVAGCQVYL